MVTQAGDSGQVGIDLDSVEYWLEHLHGDSNGLIHVCATENWSGQVCESVKEAVAYVKTMDLVSKSGIYVRATTIKGKLPSGSRGSEKDSACLPALWADVDIAGPGHAHNTRNGLPLPPDEETARGIIQACNLPEPTLWVHSGGGLYPWWMLKDTYCIQDEDDLLRARYLSRTWHEVIAHAAETLNLFYGTEVADLARVLRVVGTVNRKVADNPRQCRLSSGGSGELYTFRELMEAANEAKLLIPVPEAARLSVPVPRAESADDELRPGDDFNVRGDWQEILVPQGWQVHHSRGDTVYWTRPGKELRDGYSATTGRAADADRLYVFSSSTPFTPELAYSKFAAYSLLVHGGDYSAAARELRGLGHGGRNGSTPDQIEPADLVIGHVVEGPGEDDDVEPISVEQAHAIFKHWFGSEYDTDSLDMMLTTLAVERLDGDPLWTLLISGPGNTKTETLQSASGIGALTISTISSDAALLSGSPSREKAKDATGGLLRKLGNSGTLVVKDFTSILSMDRNTRGTTLAALREIYDGYWSRNLGTDGGKTLTWQGRIATLGAVTTAWDRHHEVISQMGDRFALLRVDSTLGRIPAGRQALANTGHEVQMRQELSQAVKGVMAGMNAQVDLSLREEEADQILAAANLVTLARTGVDYDYRGDVVDVHAPEMPTRFAKQLFQIVRGCLTLRMGRGAAMRLAIRCARDSMPPLRLAILLDVAKNPGSTTTDVRKRIGKPRSTVDRQLQSLHVLDILRCEEQPNHFGTGTKWYYHLADGIEPMALDINRYNSYPALEGTPLALAQGIGAG